MKLLLDHNLSHKLVGMLTEYFDAVVPCSSVNLATASDAQVWAFAQSRGMMIVSKDDDFRQLSQLYGHPPKVIWLRLGNVNTSTIAARLVAQRNAIAEFSQDTESAMLILE